MNRKLALRSILFGIGLFFSALAVSSTQNNSIIAPLAEKSLLLDIARAGENLVAVGSRGHILISSDEGKAWKQSQAPVNVALTSVFFADANLGWAVGHDSIIILTRDGGKTWEIKNQEPDRESPLLDIWFKDDTRTGYAVGAYGYMLNTQDGGETWNDMFLGDDPALPDDFHLNQMAKGGDTVYLAAEAGAAYLSLDDGASWVRTYPAYEGSFFGVLPLINQNVLMFGLQGNLFRSQDAGATWSQIETGTSATLNSGAVLSDGTVVVVGNEGVYLISKDGGKSFKTKSLVDRKSISSIEPTKDGGAVMVGEMGIRKLSKSDFK